MPNGDPRDGFFYPTLTLMMDSYILQKTQSNYTVKPIAGNSLFCLCIYFADSVTLQSLRMAVLRVLPNSVSFGKLIS